MKINNILNYISDTNNNKISTTINIYNKKDINLIKYLFNNKENLDYIKSIENIEEIKTISFIKKQNKIYLSGFSKVSYTKNNDKFENVISLKNLITIYKLKTL